MYSGEPFKGNQVVRSGGDKEIAQAGRRGGKSWKQWGDHSMNCDLCSIAIKNRTGDLSQLCRIGRRLYARVSNQTKDAYQDVPQDQINSEAIE